MKQEIGVADIPEPPEECKAEQTIQEPIKKQSIANQAKDGQPQQSHPRNRRINRQLQSESAVELDALLPAILDRAFKGELV